MMRKHDAEMLYALLNKFCNATCGKDIDCEMTQGEILELAGYIAYCVADESTFAEVDDFAEARTEASKWISE